MNQNVFVDAAKGYLKRGLHPIPCAVRDKIPLVSWKVYQEQAPTWDEVEAWWYGAPGSPEIPNLALVLGRGVFAIDIDGPEGERALAAAGVPLAGLLACAPPTVATGKGLHLYYRGETRDRVKLVERVDVRGVGYVIAPPSIHASGHTYQWLLNESAEIPPAPAALMQLLSRESKPRFVSGQGAGWVTRLLRGPNLGERNHAFARLVGRYWQLGLDREEIAILLRAQVDRWAGDHPFTEQEFQSTLNSITSRDGGPR